jgi:hypothetical protein
MLNELTFPATGQLVVMPRAWLTGHRDLPQQYIDSLVQAAALLRRDKAVGMAALHKNMKLDDAQEQGSVYDYFVGRVLAAQPYAQPEQLANDLQVITEASGKLKGFDVNTIIDDSLVKRAIDRGLDTA